MKYYVINRGAILGPFKLKDSVSIRDSFRAVDKDGIIEVIVRKDDEK
uniref:Uncharacterized protein n=1 Tax=Dulem virus 174 TaxID=3145651 RepID=A0AAU8B3E8_9VIRU